MCFLVQGRGHVLGTEPGGWASEGPAHQYPAAQEITQLLALVTLELPLPDILAMEPSLCLFPS